MLRADDGACGAVRWAGRFRGAILSRSDSQLREARPRNAWLFLSPHQAGGERSDRAAAQRRRRGRTYRRRELTQQKTQLLDARYAELHFPVERSVRRNGHQVGIEGSPDVE